MTLQTELELIRDIPVSSLTLENELQEIEGAEELDELIEVLGQVEGRLNDAEEQLRCQTPIGAEVENQSPDKYVSN